MGELVVEMLITVDGYAAGSESPGYFGYPGPGLDDWIDEQLAGPQVLLMGRVTYELLFAIGKDQPGDGAHRMDELPKVVFSKTLPEALEWPNSRLAQADPTDEVRALKAAGDQTLRTVGSLSIVRTLLEADLVDRLMLVVFPTILGSTGFEPMFAGLPDVSLELLDTTVLDDRVLVLEYRPVWDGSAA